MLDRSSENNYCSSRRDKLFSGESIPLCTSSLNRDGLVLLFQFIRLLFSNDLFRSFFEFEFVCFLNYCSFSVCFLTQCFFNKIVYSNFFVPCSFYFLNSSIVHEHFHLFWNILCDNRQGPHLYSPTDRVPISTPQHFNYLGLVQPLTKLWKLDRHAENKLSQEILHSEKCLDTK